MREPIPGGELSVLLAGGCSRSVAERERAAQSLARTLEHGALPLELSLRALGQP